MFKLPQNHNTAKMITQLIVGAFGDKFDEIHRAASAGVSPDKQQLMDWCLGDRAHGDGSGHDLLDKLFVLNRVIMRDFGYREPVKGKAVSPREKKVFKLLRGKRPGDLSRAMCMVEEIARDPQSCFFIAFRNLLAAPLVYQEREFEAAANLSAVGQFFMLAGVMCHYQQAQSESARKRAINGHARDRADRKTALRWFAAEKLTHPKLSKLNAAKQMYMEHIVPKSIATIRDYLKGA